MKRILVLYLTVVLLLASLAGCGKEPAPPLDQGTPASPLGVVTPFRVHMATVIIGGKITELKEHGDNVLEDWPGDIILEFNVPVNPDTLPGEFTFDNEDKTRVRGRLDHYKTRFEVPGQLKDRQGNPIRPTQYSLLRVPFTPFKAYLSEHPYVEVVNWSGNNLSPGEVVRVEFRRDVDKAHLEEQIRQALRVTYPTPVDIPHTLKWVDDSTLLITIDNLHTAEWVSLWTHDMFIKWDLKVSPLQRLVVLDANAKILEEFPLPFSVNGAVSMTDNYRKLRFGRLTMQNPIMYGTYVYTMDLGTSRVDREKTGCYEVATPEQYSTLDWVHNSFIAAAGYRQSLGSSGLGLSWDGTMLAWFSDGKMNIVETKTGTSTQYAMVTRPQPEFQNGWDPYSIYWSPDGKKLSYSSYLENHTQHSIYTLDLVTGKESLLLAGHHVRAGSPHSGHLFTRKAGSYFMVSLDGRAVLLSSPGEQVGLGRWIDGDRVLINKWNAGFLRDSKCYIYHIKENRWEYIADGTGFDYDVATGRAFVLQPR